TGVIARSRPPKQYLRQSGHAPTGHHELCKWGNLQGSRLPCCEWFNYSNLSKVTNSHMHEVTRRLRHVGSGWILGGRKGRMSRRKTGQAQVRSKDQAADKLRDEVRII